ncbi:F-box/WD repeat-containing protein [Candidatus Protochlamydia phocaeensis]|uniref:F-box/WD repeat-containing protein n=1 Tax=Candidatus Protochlamydia phocaeensis TaxID=1414722 RepID=UPI0008394B52|nr:F-box protein [Candidatus Protochlamydia phocaeensis]
MAIDQIDFSGLNSFKSVEPEPSALPLLSLSDEMLLYIFSFLKSDPHSLSKACLVDRQWHQVAGDHTLNPALRALCICSHPLIIGEQAGKFTRITSLDASHGQIVYGYGSSYAKSVCVYNLLTKETRHIRLGYNTSGFAVLVDGKLYVGTDDGIEYYDEAGHNERIVQDVLNVGPNIEHIFAQNGNKQRIAFTGLTSDSIKIYDAATKNTLEIQDERNGRDRSCLGGLTFLGERLAVGYAVFNRMNENYVSVYDAAGSKIAEKLFESHPYKMVADDNHLIVFFSNNDIKILDPDTLEEQHNLKLQVGWEHPDDRSNTLDIFALHEGKIFTLAEETFKVFDVAAGELIQEFKRPDGSKIVASSETENPISIQGSIVALGVNLSKEQYAVELWDIETGQKMHSFPTIGSAEKVKLEMGDKPQLTVGIKGGAVQVWNFEIELKQKNEAQAAPSIEEAAPIEEISSPVQAQTSRPSDLERVSLVNYLSQSNG